MAAKLTFRRSQSERLWMLNPNSGEASGLQNEGLFCLTPTSKIYETSQFWGVLSALKDQYSIVKTMTILEIGTRNRNY